MPVSKKRQDKKSHYHNGTYISQKGGSCDFRSGWEEKFLKHLDEDPTVKSFEYENVIIMYFSNVRSKKLSRYYPDFLVEYTDGRRVLIEIKPSRRVAQLKNQKKFLAAQQWCDEHDATFEIVTEVQLKALGLL
jgi:hypothetical protein